jgi:fido (protein-threonine AMPylation protein)
VADLSSFYGFRDKEPSPFYCAAGLTPQETWDEILASLEELINRLVRVRESRRVEISVDAIADWHREIFKSTFPDDAGRFRYKDPAGQWEHVEFGVDVGTRRSRVVRWRSGRHPARIRHGLVTVIQQLDQATNDLEQMGSRRELLDATFIAGRLYARILSIHPFVDGNLRTAYVALSVTLLNLGLPMVEFADLAVHDERLGSALRVDGKQDYRPFSELIQEIIKKAP